MTTYTPRPLTDEQRAEAMRATVKLTERRSMAQIRAGILAICAANIQLAAEINEHRAALGIEPLPLYHP
jgi:hypothetical protein